MTIEQLRCTLQWTLLPSLLSPLSGSSVCCTCGTTTYAILLIDGIEILGANHMVDAERGGGGVRTGWCQSGPGCIGATSMDTKYVLAFHMKVPCFSPVFLFLSFSRFEWH